MNKHKTPASQAAALLGSMAAGVPKTLSSKERKRRRQSMRAIAEDYNAKLAAGTVTRAKRGKAKP